MIWNAILPGIVLLGLVIFVHELGHFLMAKWRGVKVLRFSLGFGPALLGFTRGETEYRLSWIPLGGYVQMAGDSPGEDGSMPATREEFLSHPWFGRLLIAVAGPGANLVTAYLVLVVACLLGVRSPDFDTIADFVPDTSAAWQAGLRTGDEIVSAGEAPIRRWSQVDEVVEKLGPERPLHLGVRRGSSLVTIAVPPERRREVLASMVSASIPPVVGSVVTGMPAYKAGLKEGDRILAIEGRRIEVWADLLRALRGRVDQPVRVTVERAGQRFDLTVKPIDPEGKRGSREARIGIEPQHQGTYLVGRYPLPQAIQAGWNGTVAIIGNVYGGLWLTLSRPVYYREYVGGPLFIAQAASQQARRGLDAFLQFLALINVAIMAFNLLPLPVLDGGHIVLALTEALRRQAISARTYLRFQKVGLVVMGLLFVLILANDPLRLVQRQRALDRAPAPAREGPVAPP